MTSPLLPPTYCLHLDESSQTKHRYLTLGCMVQDVRVVSFFEAAVTHAKKLELPAGELKWNKVSQSKLFAYKLVIDCFFDYNTGGTPLDFHTLVVDTSKRKDHVFNAGSREIGFNKEVYQLFMKCGRLYPDCLFHAYPDHRETSSDQEELRLILNNGRRKDGDGRNSPFRRVQFRDSKDVLSLQIVDLLLGALTFHLNGHHLADNCNTAKRHLSEYVLERAGIRDPFADTRRRGKFTIWHRKLR